jgi:hypothetical protein
MRYAGRLARLWRAVALLPPRDPLAAMSDEEMARATRVIHAEIARGKPWADQFPSASPEDVAWFDGAIRPHLPRYSAFCDALLRWQQRMKPARGPWDRLACISPAFAGRGRPRMRLPAGHLQALLPASLA